MYLLDFLGVFDHERGELVDEENSGGRAAIRELVERLKHGLSATDNTLGWSGFTLFLKENTYAHYPRYCIWGR